MEVYSRHWNCPPFIPVAAVRCTMAIGFPFIPVAAVHMCTTAIVSIVHSPIHSCGGCTSYFLQHDLSYGAINQMGSWPLDAYHPYQFSGQSDNVKKSSVLIGPKPCSPFSHGPAVHVVKYQPDWWRSNTKRVLAPPGPRPPRLRPPGGTRLSFGESLPKNGVQGGHLTSDAVFD